jgi:UDP-N-acetylmuramate dehydrogenase
MALNPRLRARLERESEQERRLTREQKDEMAALLPEGAVLFDEPTALHSVVRAGGPVEAFVTARDVDDLKRVLEWADTHSVEYRFWGVGAFTLVRDGGLSGIIIKLGNSFREIAVEGTGGDDVFVSVGAAAKTRELLNFARAEGLAGAERLTGAQGTVAGLLCAASIPRDFVLEGMIEELTMVTRDMRELTLRGSGLRFEDGRLRIPRTAAVTKLLLKFRKSTTEEVSRALEEGFKSAQPSDEQPHYSFAFESPCKTKAADLIDDAGLLGVRVGGARISTVKGDSIVNESEAKARDVAILISLVRDHVKQDMGVVLTATIDVVGER